MGGWGRGGCATLERAEAWGGTALPSGSERAPGSGGGGHGETRDWMEGREVKGNAELPLSGVGLARPDRGQPVGAGMALSRASRPLLS